MYDLLTALKRIIERKVVNIQPLREDVSAGTQTLLIRNAKRFEPSEHIVLYREGEEDGEPHIISSIPNYRTIVLESPIGEDYTATTSKVQNLVAGCQWIHAIYIGDPPVIPRYPAITINGTSRSSEWLTIDSTTERFEVDISIYLEAAFWERGYEYVLNLTRSIERSLYFTFYPLVFPYHTTLLTEDVSATDTVIRVEDDNLNRRFIWFFIENDQYTRHARPRNYLDNGVIELMTSLGVPFEAGDEVILPGRHFYDTRPIRTDYGTAGKEGKLLKVARISYFATEEVIRANMFYLPIDRP